MEYSDYPPRNEYQLCELFEDLLFMRSEKFMPKEDQKESERFRLTEKEIQLLHKLGILNRIFRRWFQTTWGYEGNSEHFKGETPRQELARLHSELNKGEEYLSVKLAKQEKDWRIVPCYFSKRILEKEGGVFEYGLKNLEGRKDEIVEPQLDCEFKTFADWLKQGEKVVKKMKPEIKFENEFIKYWKLFLETAPSNLVLNCQMKLTDKEFASLSFKFRNCLIQFFSSQPYGEDNYLDVDKIFFQLWEILRESNKNLPVFQEVIGGEGKKRIERIKKDKEFKEAAGIFYRLGVAFDRYILFPIDRYFGGAEIVWTDQKTFFNDLTVSILLLKKNLKIKTTQTQREFLDIGDITYNIRYLWFAPSTSFRLLGPIFQYFH